MATLNPNVDTVPYPCMHYMEAKESCCFFVQKKLTLSASALEFRPPPSGLKQQENKKPPQEPSIRPPLNQQKRKNSQDPVPHWCWSPTKALGAGERFLCGGGGFRCTTSGLGRFWCLKGLTADAETWRGRPKVKSGKKNGEGPPAQNFSSVFVEAEVHELTPD